MLVLDVDVPSHFAGRCSEARHQQVYVLLTRWAEHERGPAWTRVNLLTDTCHLPWLIRPIYAAAEAISANTRLLTAARAAGRPRRPDRWISTGTGKWPRKLVAGKTPPSQLRDPCPTSGRGGSTTPTSCCRENTSPGWLNLAQQCGRTARTVRAMSASHGQFPSSAPSAVSPSTPAGAGTRNPGQPTTTGATDATPPPRSVCSRGVLRAHPCAHPCAHPSDSRRRMRGTPRGRPELSVSSHPGYATTPPHASCAAITRKSLTDAVLLGECVHTRMVRRHRTPVTHA